MYLLSVFKWFSPGPPVFSTNKTDRHDYNWNIVESGVKHHQTNKLYLNSVGSYSHVISIYMYTFLHKST
jgi:hypothetical protein